MYELHAKLQGKRWSFLAIQWSVWFIVGEKHSGSWKKVGFAWHSCGHEWKKKIKFKFQAQSSYKNYFFSGLIVSH